MKRRKLCNIRDHDWKTTRGGYETCTKCGTRFPCRDLSCGHIDCYSQRDGRGHLMLGIVVHDPTKPEEPT